MKRLFLRIFSLTMIFFVADPILGAQQQKSTTEKSFLRAREVVDAGIKAMGGLEELQNIADITREMSGTRSDQGQGMRPVSLSGSDQPPVTNTYTKATSVRDLRGGRVMEYRETRIFGGQPFTSRNVVTPSLAFFANYITKTVSVTPPAAIPGARARNFRRFPESLLQTAWNRPETLRWVGEADFEGRGQRVVSFADADGAQVAIYFDAATNLPTKFETLGDDPILGDITIETIYSDWRPLNKVRLPFKYVDRIGGAVLQRFDVTSTTINTKLTDSLFAIGEGLTKIEPTPSAPTVKKLGQDVYAILGPYNSVFVVFNDHVLVIEAGANNRYSAASIAEIRKIAPVKPIRYLISTHFHFDHLGGVRSYIAEGTIIVTTPTAKSTIEKAAAATHVMRPDALSRNPKSPIIETVNDKRVFDDATHKVELYRIASPHVGEMIIAYLPKEKILFEADMMDIPEAGVPSVGDDTIDLALQIHRLDLQVQTIVPVHGRIGTMEDLRQSIANRSPIR